MSLEVGMFRNYSRLETELPPVSTMGVVLVPVHYSSEGLSVLLLHHKPNASKGISDGMLGLPSETSKYRKTNKGIEKESDLGTLIRLMNSELQIDMEQYPMYHQERWTRTLKVNRKVPLDQDSNPANRDTRVQLYVVRVPQKNDTPETEETHGGSFFPVEQVLYDKSLSFRGFPDTPGLLQLLHQEGYFDPHPVHRLSGLLSVTPFADHDPDYHNI